MDNLYFRYSQVIKNTIILLVILFSFSSWKADTKGPWIVTKSKRIILYTRPLNYSKTDSPDSIALNRILKEEEQAIDTINKRLGLNFNSKVKIYLYNLDEAKEKIGTNGGGFASLKIYKKCIYFTYRSQPSFNTISNKLEYVGIHEMVHVITWHELGRNGSCYFWEGYANAIDGNYGSAMVNNKLTWRRNDSNIISIIKSGKLLKPSVFMSYTNLPEGERYPQLGCFFDWLFKTYGAEKINRLFNVEQNKIPIEFQKITGDKYEDMEANYMKYQLDKKQ